MCGIAGGVGLGEHQESMVRDLVSHLSCRGPDQSGYVALATEDSLTSFGHSRLRILDLSQHASQPMLARDSGVALSYNGEVYNYVELRAELAKLGWVFRGCGDTEVVLAALSIWGTAALTRFNGAFAAAVWFRNARQLVLFRSRFGSKPVYFRHYPGQVMFSSTADSIANVVGANLNLGFLARGLTSLAYEGNGNETAFEGVLEVSPGTSVIFDLANESIPFGISRWYSLEERVREASPLGPDAALAVFSTTLTQSVELRLRADVPVGISLSGGLDSSSIAALVSTLREPSDFQTYSYTWGEHDPERAGVLFLLRMLRRPPSSHTWVYPPTSGRIPQILERVFQAQGAPFASLSVAAQQLVFDAASRQGTRVMLGGQGADETLMGYRKYIGLDLKAKAQKWQMTGVSSHLPGIGASIGADWRVLPQYVSSGRRYFAKPPRNALSFALPPKWHMNLPRDPLSMSLADIQSLSLPTLLRYEDRSSMASSVESRLPFLDYHLVECALGLTLADKVRRGRGKWALRQEMDGRLPSEIVWSRSKRGFFAGDRVWLDAGAGHWLRERISDSAPYLENLGISRSHLRDHQRWSDRRLALSPGAMHEAISLAWIGSWIARH